MKHFLKRRFYGVTPRAGVWIEISVSKRVAISGSVTPRAGVWIEIYEAFTGAPSFKVTPRAGVWIEILYNTDGYKLLTCHSPCGSVD